MQSSIFLVLLTSFVCCFHSTAALANSSKVLIMGDSLSAAYNIPMEQSWPIIFQQRMKNINPSNRVVNASISGETTNGGLERLQQLLDQHQPSHMILELGGNDGLRGYKFSQTTQNLTAMINIALQQNIKVLLIGIRLPPNLGPVYNQRFQKIFEQLAEQMPVAYLPRFLQGIAASKAEYMQADGIHPTALAQPLLADKVLTVFKDSF